MPDDGRRCQDDAGAAPRTAASTHRRKWHSGSRIGASGPRSAPENAIRCRPASAGCGFCRPWTPSDVTLNICVSYRLTGALDEARLRSAFDDVVARHAILRTVYGVDSEGEPYQVFSDGAQIGWRTDDVTQLPASRAAASDRGAGARRVRPPIRFDQRAAAAGHPDPQRHRRIRAAARGASHRLGRRFLGRLLRRAQRRLQR